MAHLAVTLGYILFDNSHIPHASEFGDA